MKIYDISIPIKTGMITWPGDPSVKLEKIASLEAGDDANITVIEMCVHTGTHIDAPNHYLTEGKTVDQLSMEALFGEVLVIEIDPSVTIITERVLASHSDIELLKKFARVLFKTRNSESSQSHPQTFQTDYVGIDSSGAAFLAGMNLTLVGLDYLSIATYRDTCQPHAILLSRDVTLLEGINLSNVAAGSYQLFCAPLSIEGCEGAPARVFLMQ